MATSKKLEGVTPNGGVRSEIYYLNDERELVDEAVATAAEIVEFKENGDIIKRTYGTFNNEKKKGTNNG